MSKLLPITLGTTWTKIKPKAVLNLWELFREFGATLEIAIQHSSTE